MGVQHLNLWCVHISDADFCQYDQIKGSFQLDEHERIEAEMSEVVYGTGCNHVTWMSKLDPVAFLTRRLVYSTTDSELKGSILSRSSSEVK